MTALWLACVLMIAIWVEIGPLADDPPAGRAARRDRARRRRISLAAGLALGLWMQLEGYLLYLLIVFNPYIRPTPQLTWLDGLVTGCGWA